MIFTEIVCIAEKVQEWMRWMREETREEGRDELLSCMVITVESYEMEKEKLKKENEKGKN